MANRQLSKFGVPIVGQAMSTTTGVRQAAGATCGIEPLKPASKPPPPAVRQLPSHLIRPPCHPCMAGTKQSTTIGSCFSPSDAFYCTPQKIKYRYPPFSENIDFVPTGEVECWWAKPRVCDMPEDDDSSITRQ